MGTKINQLLLNADSDGLFFSGWMKSQGYSDQLQKKYRDSGWLTSLSQGVMYRTGSKLSRLFGIGFMQPTNGNKVPHSRTFCTGVCRLQPLCADGKASIDRCVK